MTSRTRPAPRTIDRRSAPLAALILIACAALSGACGVLSRPMLAQLDSSKATTPAQQDELLGADPMLWRLWLWSAQRRPAPEPALAVLERGRQFHPREPELMLAQVSLLTLLQRFDAIEQLARAGLQSECPPELEVELRWSLVIAELGVNDTAAAEAEVVRLGGVRGVPPEQVADSWARIAATHEFLGHADQADQALERSLDLGAAGLVALREVSAREPQRQAACESLLTRARARHPDHPDLAVQRVINALVTQNAAAAEQALAELPTPLPTRLESTVAMLRVHIDVLAGRTDAALAVLRPRLDDDPGDTEALAALIECWRLRQVPSKEEMRLRLTWAAGRVQHPGVAAQVQALLRELSPPPAPATPTAPATAPASTTEPSAPAPTSPR